MVSITHSGNIITGSIWSQGRIRFRVEVDFIEGRGDYWRICFKGGTEIIPPAWNRGDQGQAPLRWEPIIVQGGSKEEEGKAIPGGYRHQGDPIEMGFFLTPVSLLQLYIVSIPVDCTQYAHNRILIPEYTSRKHHEHKQRKPIVTCICSTTHS